MPPDHFENHRNNTDIGNDKEEQEEENREKKNIISTTTLELDHTKNKCNAVFRENFSHVTDQIGKTLQKQKTNIEAQYNKFKEANIGKNNEIQENDISRLKNEIQDIYKNNEYIEVSEGRSNFQQEKFEALYKEKLNQASVNRITEDWKESDEEAEKNLKKHFFSLETNTVYKYIQQSIYEKYDNENLSVEDKAEIKKEIEEKFQEFLYEKIQWKIRNLSPQEEYFIQEKVEKQLQTELENRQDENLSPQEIEEIRLKIHKETLTLYIYKGLDADAQRFMINPKYEEVAEKAEENREADEAEIEITQEEYESYNYTPAPGVTSQKLGKEEKDTKEKDKEKNTERKLTEEEKAKIEEEKEEEIKNAKDILGISSEKTSRLGKNKNGVFIEKSASVNAKNSEQIRIYLPDNQDTHETFLVEIKDGTHGGKNDIALKVTKENMQEKIEKVSADSIMNTLHLENFFPLLAKSDKPADDTMLQFVNICMQNGGTGLALNEEKYTTDAQIFTPTQAFEKVMSVLRNIVGIPYPQNFSLDDARQDKQNFDTSFLQEKFTQLGMLDDTNMLDFKQLNLFKKLSRFQVEIGGPFLTQKEFIQKLKTLDNAKLEKHEKHGDNEIYTLTLQNESITFSASEETGFRIQEQE